jgi:hypothetical protein
MSKFTHTLFSNSPHKTETGIAKGGRLLIAIHLDQSNFLANQQQVLGFDVSFTSLSILVKNAGPKLFCWAKTILLSQTSMLRLFFIQFSFAGPHTEHHF